MITTTSRLSGAIHSLTWMGKEFIDLADHGLQLQSASSFDVGNKDFWPEAYNPTEAGSRRWCGADQFQQAGRDRGSWEQKLNTIVQPAFWLAPGELSGKFPARNKQVISNHLITKQVTIGYKNYAHAIDYRVTFSVPAGEKHTLGQFEAVTGYMPAEFTKFWSLDPKTGQMNPLTDGPGEQKDPVIFSTANGMWAMGVWLPDQPSKGYESIGYGRFRFAPEKVVKWNCVFRVKDPVAIKTGNYDYRAFVIIGTAQNVRDTMVGLIHEKEFQK